MTNKSRLWQILVAAAAGLVAAALIGWWIARLFQEDEEVEEALWVPPRQSDSANIPLPKPQEYEIDLNAPGTPEPDEPPVTAIVDLTRIDGIGPKYAEGLQRLGIMTYAQLAAQNPDELAEQLKEQGLRILGDRIEQENWIGQAQQLAQELS
jgi:predicted flap endonuclease-1-like 5' DNA nuclease